MIYIPIKYLQPGMVLAKDAPSDSYLFALVAAGQRLTEKAIAKLAAHGMQGAYIESPGCGTEEADEFIDPRTKQEMLSNIKALCNDYLSQSGVSAGMYRAVAEAAVNIVDFVLSKDEFLLNIIDIRDYDSYTYSHSLFVGILSVMIGVQLHYTHSVLVDLAMSGLLHDIGKLDLPVELVNKPGILTPEEYKLMQQHPKLAADRLRQNRLFSYTVISGVESHHERFDGTGYPRQLKGENIPLFGRILALADVYDALISNRPYRNAWPAGKAIEYMLSGSGTHFDCELLQNFLDVVSAYPVGTVVKLSNQFWAVVIRNTPGHSLRPTVRILWPPEEKKREIDLARDKDSLNITVTETLDENKGPLEDILK